MTAMKPRTIASVAGWVTLLLFAIGIHAFGMQSGRYTCPDMGLQEA